MTVLPAWPFRNSCPSRWLAATSLAAAFVALQVAAADAQQRQRQPQPPPAPPSRWVDCPDVSQPLIRIPELVSQNGQLRATIALQDDQQMRLAFKQGDGTNRCAPQRVRYFTGLNAVLPDYPGEPPPGYGGVPPIPVNQTANPVPGPTLRARVGDIVQLTFLNQVDPNHYGDSIDRGERGQGCDETRIYPGLDTFPDCFHGSSTGNIHFHGTHTNPSSTGDNVFIEVRPSLRDNNQPIVTDANVRGPFDEFFSVCEIELRNNVLSQWPRAWSDLPTAWTSRQEQLLKAYDSNPAIKNKLWPVNETQLKAGAWPQYYIGAYPYCFALPRFIPPTPNQVAQPASHGHGGAEQSRALVMGQSPGTHWYHAHKHGSTTINVSNGMTGAFIIEGPYDDAFNTFYGTGWTRRQPVMVLNQLGVSPNLMRGGGPHQDISVNGRLQPKLTMRPGEVQLWRIANTSSRSGIFLIGFNPPTTPSGIAFGPFQWKQTAQDGVQFAGINYQNSVNPQLVIAPGNRVDLLVQAPAVPTPAGQPYTLMMRQVRSQCETLAANQIPTIPTTPTASPICSPDPDEPLLTVEVAGAPATGAQAQFIPPAQLQAAFPTFLGDITGAEVKATKIVEFESVPQATGRPAVMHMIDGHKFDGNIGQVVRLNTVEEWKMVNRTVNGGIQDGHVVPTDPPGVVDHPFHIHINPFQIIEVFDPNEVLPGTATPRYIFQGQPQAGQCLLDITRPETWKPCGNTGPQTNLIWWDVFPIPTGRAVFTGSGANMQVTVVPGYFKMRSRFVDFSGQYVMHCHILAHEDRGMMTVVQVTPFRTPYSHQ